MAVESQVKDQQALFTLDPVHGFLRFKDQEAFTQTLNYLFKRHYQSLDSFEASIPGFVSQRAAYNAIDTDEERMEIVNNPQEHPYRNFLVILKDEFGEFEARRVVETPGLSSIVSNKGLVFIGNDLYKYTRTQLFSMTNPKEEEIAVLTENPMSIPSALVRVDQIDYQVLRKKSDLESTANLASRTTNYTLGGKNFRFRVYIIRETNPPFINTFLRSENQRRTVFWFNDKVDSLRTISENYSFTYNLGAGNVTETGSTDLFVVDESEDLIGIGSCSFCSVVATNVTSTHRLFHVEKNNPLNTRTIVEVLTAN